MVYKDTELKEYVFSVLLVRKETCICIIVIVTGFQLRAEHTATEELAGHDWGCHMEFLRPRTSPPS